MKKKAPFNENAAIRGAIRRVFARSPLVREVLMDGRREVPKYNKDGSLAKKPAVQYSCQVCGDWVSSTKMAVDHIEPVISTDDGFVDWNTFIARLWCDKSNLQRICDTCHQIKTNKERWDRMLKKDMELLEELERLQVISRAESTRLTIVEGLKKFNKKKMEAYPKEIVLRVQALKDRFAPKKGKKVK